MSKCCQQGMERQDSDIMVQDTRGAVAASSIYIYPQQTNLQQAAASATIHTRSQTTRPVESASLTSPSPALQEQQKQLQQQPSYMCAPQQQQPTMPASSAMMQPQQSQPQPYKQAWLQKLMPWNRQPTTEVPGAATATQQPATVLTYSSGGSNKRQSSAGAPRVINTDTTATSNVARPLVSHMT